MSVVFDRYLQRSRAALELVENWNVAGDRTTFASDLEELMCECIDLGGLAGHTWVALREFLVSDPNGDIVDEAENTLKLAMSKTTEFLKAVDELVAEATMKGFAIKNASKFHGSAQEIRQFNAKIESVYPPFDHAAAEESRQAFLRGECIPIEDLIEELTRESQSVGVPSH